MEGVRALCEAAARSPLSPNLQPIEAPAPSPTGGNGDNIKLPVLNGNAAERAAPATRATTGDSRDPRCRASTAASAAQPAAATTVAHTSVAAAQLAANATGGTGGVVALRSAANNLFAAGEECMTDEKQARHLDAAACFVGASLKCAQAAFLLERQQAAAGAQAMLLFAFEMLKQHATSALHHSDEYLVAALAHKCASACAMRAFRLRQKDCARLAKQSREEIAGLWDGLDPSTTPADHAFNLSAASVARADKLLHMLQVLCNVVEDFDTSQSMRRALSLDVSEEQRELLPKLDGASPVSMTTQETIELLQSLLKAVESRGGKVVQNRIA